MWVTRSSTIFPSSRTWTLFPARSSSLLCNRPDIMTLSPIYAELGLISRESCVGFNSLAATYCSFRSVLISVRLSSNCCIRTRLSISLKYAFWISEVSFPRKIPNFSPMLSVALNKSSSSNLACFTWFSAISRFCRALSV